MHVRTLQENNVRNRIEAENLAGRNAERYALIVKLYAHLQLRLHSSLCIYKYMIYI